MKNLKQNRPRYIFKNIVLPSLIFVAMAGVLILGIYKFNEMSTEQDLELTKAALNKAVIQCYADEGRYPSEISYLEEHYNVTIDYDRFFVRYDCAAANVFPNISVFRRTEAKRDE